jgi:hypothetical protein
MNPAWLEQHKEEIILKSEQLYEEWKNRLFIEKDNGPELVEQFGKEKFKEIKEEVSRVIFLTSVMK